MRSGWLLRSSELIEAQAERGMLYAKAGLVEQGTIARFKYEKEKLS